MDKLLQNTDGHKVNMALIASVWALSWLHVHVFDPMQMVLSSTDEMAITATIVIVINTLTTMMLKRKQAVELAVVASGTGDGNAPGK